MEFSPSVFLTVSNGLKRPGFYIAEKSSQCINKMLNKWLVQNGCSSETVLMPCKSPVAQYSLDVMKDCTSIYVAKITPTW